MRSPQQALWHLIALNLGRLTMYCALGALVYSIGYLVFINLDLANISRWMRVISGLIVVLIGVQLLLNEKRPFGFLEFLGNKLWEKGNRFMNLGSGKLSRSYSNGLIWGLLPCGLVYGVLLTTAFADGIASSSLIMLGFGLGTLPSLTLTGMFYRKYRQTLSSGSVQTAGGLFFIAGGLMTITAPFWISTEFMNAYPQLNSVFCITG